MTEEIGAKDSQGHYSSWEQIAGYFDGDGNVGLEVVDRVLRFKIRFVDTWKPQIEAVASFLTSEGIRCGNIGKGDKRGNWQVAYRLDVVGVQSVLHAAKQMVNYTVKKRLDLLVLIDYLENRITGNDAIRILNQEVAAGRRRGKPRTEGVPYARSEGLRLSQIENAKKAREAHAVNVSDGIEKSIRWDHYENKLGHVRLSKKYGYSVSVIRRILGEP
jgi:hypothetical protein